MSVPDPIADARMLLQMGLRHRVFPAAVAEVGDARSTLWREAFGALTFERDAAATRDDTIFDIASLTKPIATTSLILDLVSEGLLDLDERVAEAFPDWRALDRERVTVQDLLEHCGGLAPRLLDAPPRTRREFEYEIATMPLEYEPRTRSVYTDLGFILLGFLIADRGRASLAHQFAEMIARVTVRTRTSGDEIAMGFGVAASRRSNTAPTLPLEEDIRHGRTLIGAVHDNYAAALAGAAGHAGLFATAPDIGAFARACLRACAGDTTIPSPLSPALVARARRKSTVPGSSRALGWDAMLPTSSCGPALSPAAFGHVGFTGVSLWIDPGLDRYFVLLTNRACGGGTSDHLQAIRRDFHQALARL